MSYVIRITFYVFTLFLNSTLVLKVTPFPVHRANFVLGKGVFVFSFQICSLFSFFERKKHLKLKGEAIVWLRYSFSLMSLFT